MPPLSEKQRRAMWAAAAGHSNLGIPKSVGAEFVKNDAAGKPDLGDVTDYEAAEMVRDGELPSPTKYGDFWVFDLRITGTGVAFRDSLDEWAIRDPKVWTTPEFIERCNGLPVIFGHPPRSGLNDDEYKKRSVGQIVLPYRKDDEVWGIARIYDATAADLMQKSHRSTSPGVMPPKGSVATEMKDGTKVLAEDAPLILDHLAICELGVWDKDGPPAGIRLDSKGDASVDEEQQKALEKERDDAKARADAAEAQLADARGRADSAEQELEDAKKADAKRKADAESEESERAAEQAKADRAKRHDCPRMDAESDEDYEQRKADARKDASEEEREELEKRDAEREDKRKKDAAKTEAINANEGNVLKDSKLRDQVNRHAEMLEAMNRPLSIADQNEIAEVGLRADSLYQMVGDVAPKYRAGEKPLSYRRRLVDGLRKYTESWGEYAIHDAIDEKAFGVIEKQIYAEAEAFAKSPKANPDGVLREIREVGLGGKPVVRFVGDAKACWAPFQHPVRRLIRRIGGKNATGSAA